MICIARKVTFILFSVLQGFEVLWHECSEISNVSIYTHYYKIGSNKNLLYSTGNSTECSVMAYMDKNLKKKKRVDICVTDSFCYTPETNTTL